MKKIIITGATGFVGGSLARALASRGWRVVGLRRAGSKDPHNLEMEWVVGDVLNMASLDGLFVDADAVIHAAGMLGQAGVPESAYWRLHVDGTRNVLEAVHKQAPAARVLYVSSPGVLGPIDGEAADETTPMRPSNPYERSKAAAETVVRCHAGRGADVVIARPEFIYGPGDSHVLGLFLAVQRGMFFYVGNGRATCHPTYIDDAVEGMIRCLEAGRSGEIYHITGLEPVTFEALGETIATALDGRVPWLYLPRWLAYGGAMMLEVLGKLTGMTAPLSRTGVAFFSENRRFDWQKARREIGYEPRFDLSEGVQKTVNWYREHGWL